MAGFGEPDMLVTSLKNSHLDLIHQCGGEREEGKVLCRQVALHRLGAELRRHQAADFAASWLARRIKDTSFIVYMHLVHIKISSRPGASSSTLALPRAVVSLLPLARQRPSSALAVVLIYSSRVPLLVARRC